MLWTVVMNTFATWRESDVMGGGRRLMDRVRLVVLWGVGRGVEGVLKFNELIINSQVRLFSQLCLLLKGKYISACHLTILY